MIKLGMFVNSCLSSVQTVLDCCSFGSGFEKETDIVDIRQNSNHSKIVPGVSATFYCFLFLKPKITHQEKTDMQTHLVVVVKESVSCFWWVNTP